MPLTLWGTWTPGPRTWPARLFVDAVCTVLARLLAGISGGSRLGPNVEASLAGFKEVSYYIA